MATKKVAKKKEQKTVYTATFTLMGKKYTGKGKTALEALTDMKVKVPVVKVKSVLSMNKVVKEGAKKIEDVTKEKVIMPAMVARCFNLSPTMREVGLKQLSLIFDI